MTYREIKVDLASADLQTACDIADMLDLGGMYVEDYSDFEENAVVKQVGLVDEELLKKDKTKAVMHIYLDMETDVEECVAYLSDRFSEKGIRYELSVSVMDDSEYATAWQQYYKPFKVGTLTVVPEWEEYYPAPDERLLIMNPGVAFGTGMHETTSMCMEALQDTLKGGETVLDVGCGSGVLSATSFLCGARSALALDIDADAVKVAYENVALNYKGDGFSAYCDNILDPESEIRRSLCGKRFDTVVANIVADIIIELSSFISEYIADGGRFIMSGIIAEREADVLAALEKNSFTVEDVCRKNGWVCIIAR